MNMSTYVDRRERLLWPTALNPLSHTDVFRDQVLLIDRLSFHRSVIAWSLVAGFDALLVDMRRPPGDDSDPRSNDELEIRRLGSLVSYANELGIRVVLMDSLSDRLEHLASSIDLGGLCFIEAYRDGTSSGNEAVERISNLVCSLRKDRRDLLCVYLPEDSAISPKDLRARLPEPTILIINPQDDETVSLYTDFRCLFPYWHRVSVFDGPQGIHARLAGAAEFSAIRRRIDETIASGARGLLADARLIRNHEAALLYLVSLTRNPHLNLKDFHVRFCRKFFNHTTKSFLGWEAYWGGHYGYAYECFRKAFDNASEPIVRDRIRDMALSSLFLDIEWKMRSAPDSEEFSSEQQQRIDEALNSMPDPFSSAPGDDVWNREFRVLLERPD